MRGAKTLLNASLALLAGMGVVVEGWQGRADHRGGHRSHGGDAASEIPEPALSIPGDHGVSHEDAQPVDGGP